MSINLVPFNSDGGFITAGNISTASYASPAPTISGFSTVSADNFRLMDGNITGGIATVVDDGIYSIALALGAQMDVIGFPFSQSTRGQLTISGVATPSEVNGTWYYQSINTNTYQIYTDNTYSTLVDATGWDAYTGGGTVAIVKQVPAANIVINTNGFLSKFNNDGQVILPGSLSTSGDIGTDGDIIGSNVSAVNVNTSGNIDIDGEASIGGNLIIVGNITFSGGGSITEVTSAYGNFFGNADGSNALYAGVPGGTVVPSAIAQFTGDANAYMQVNFENKNHGTQASMELAITGDLGTDTTDYIDIGFSSSTWDGTQDNSLGNAVAARDGYMYVQGGGGGGNLILGTTTSGTKIKFNAGGPNSANTVATIDSTGFTATGNVTAGHLKGEGGNISNVQISNIAGLGNIATLNLTGSSSNVLYGNGVFAPASGGGSTSNISNGTSNVNISTSNGNVEIVSSGNVIANITGTGANITGTLSATANITTDGYFISGNQATGGFQLGNVNSRIKVGGGNTYMTFGTNPSIFPDTSSSASAGLLIGGGGYILGPGGARALTLGASDGNVGITGSLNVLNGGNLSTTGNVNGGAITSTGSITRSGSMASAPWTTNGIGLKLPSALYNETSAPGGTVAASYIHSMGSPTLIASNATTYTNYATLFVAGPTPSTNVTITNNLAILASGNVSVTGNANVGNIGANNAVFTSVSGNGSSLSSLTGANVTGAVAFATTANSVAVANVSGIGNIATINKDGNASNVLYGNGVFASGGSGGTYGNSNVATFLAAYGSNTITTTGNVSVGNIIATNLGNIAALNLTGSSSNVLYGNGVFAPVSGGSGGSNIANGNSNVNIATANGNVTIAAVGNSVVTITGTGANISGTLSVSGNANVGNIGSTNIIATGGVFATGSLQGANLTVNPSGAQPQSIILGNGYSNASTAQLIDIGGNSSGGAGSSVRILHSPSGAGTPNVSILANVTGAAGIVQIGGFSNTSNGTSIGIGLNTVNGPMSVGIANNFSSTSNSNVNIGIANVFNGNTTTGFGNIIMSIAGQMVGPNSKATIGIGNAMGAVSGNMNIGIGNAMTSVSANGILNIGIGNASQGSNAVTSIGIGNSINTGNSTKAFQIDIGSSGSANGVINIGNSNTSTTMTGNVTVNSSSGIVTPNLPAFRVVGTVSTTWGPNVTITSTQGATVDYNQGSYYNNTTGTFTAPVAGLYQINISARNGANSSSYSQIAAVKNLAGTSNVQCMLEFGANSSMDHAGVGTVAKLAVNDTLNLRVLVGSLQFDSNDNWTVTFLG